MMIKRFKKIHRSENGTKLNYYFFRFLSIISSFHTFSSFTYFDPLLTKKRTKCPRKKKNILSFFYILYVLISLSPIYFHDTLRTQRGSDELLSQTAVMAPAADNNNQDLATKKAKLDSNSVIGGVGKSSSMSEYFFYVLLLFFAE